MTSGDIVGMLEAKHHEAVFVTECKLGPTQAGCRRLDAWALLKTWSPPTAIGYEVKVSRSDFLQDRKWPSYLPVCHELYFVCPAKLIAPEELPPDVGLLWTAGTRLVTKRKAVHRAVDPAALVDLMTYVLMSRTRIVGDMFEAQRSEPAHYWRSWLEEKAENQRLGGEVSRRIRQMWQEARAAQQRAESERDRLKHVEERLDALGFPRSAGTRQIQQQLPEHTRVCLERIRNLVGEISSEVRRLA